jgi:hypothetical protein
VRRCDVDTQLGHQAREARRLSFGQVQDQARQRGGVDDRVLERALEATADEPGVERVVAVLHQHCALGEAQESAPCVFELGGADEHRAVDVVALARVGIDGRPTVDERVEEGQCAIQAEALGADLEDEKGRVARRLHVEGDELGVVEWGRRPDLGRVDRDLLPGHGLRGPARLEVQRTGAHDRAIASARRAQRISSPVRPRSSSTAAA